MSRKVFQIKITPVKFNAGASGETAENLIRLGEYVSPNSSHLDEFYLFCASDQ